jgi:hypothetical protein
MILRTLLAHGVEFVVIGGLAVGAHGYPRGTKAVDLVPSPNRENLRLLHAALSELGAEPLEIGDFRHEELPVPFAPDGLDEGGNWALRTSPGGSTCSSGSPASRAATNTCARTRSRMRSPVSATSRSRATPILVGMKRAAGRARSSASRRCTRTTRCGRCALPRSAAEELRCGLTELNEELERSYGMRLGLRIGVKTGEVRHRY